jgi:hypothetical protein
MTRPRIGPCRDPLHLWFLEWADARGQVWRRYFADRAEARAAIKAFRATGIAATSGTRENGNAPRTRP